MPVRTTQRRRPQAAAVILLGAVLSGAWFGSPLSTVDAERPADAYQSLNLILSTATRGQMLPCGHCKLKAGGLARRATIIAASRDTADFVLVADGGDLLLPGEADPQVEAFLVQMHARLGYSVLGVGEGDLRRGVRYLEDLVAPHPELEWVSANILDAASGEPLFRPYVLKPAGEVVIAFTSVLEPELWAEEDAAQHPEIAVAPPIAALTALMPTLKRESHLVVCLAHERFLAIRDLAAGVEGVDIIVAGHGPRVDNYPQRFGHARQVFFGGVEGRFLNWSNVHIGPDLADPLNGRTFYLLDGTPEDSTIARDVLAFFGTREPPGDDEIWNEEPAGEDPSDEDLETAPGGAR